MKLAMRINNFITNVLIPHIMRVIIDPPPSAPDETYCLFQQYHGQHTNPQDSAVDEAYYV